MRIHKGSAAAALAVATFATLTGCGDSKGPSRAELIVKADPICERAINELRANPFTTPSGMANASEVASYYQRATEELAKLTPPFSMTADWRVIISSWRTGAEDLRQLGEAAEAKDWRRELEADGRFSKTQNDRSVIAQRDGFDQCSKF